MDVKKLFGFIQPIAKEKICAIKVDNPNVAMDGTLRAPGALIELAEKSREENKGFTAF